MNIRNSVDLPDWPAMRKGLRKTSALIYVLAFLCLAVVEALFLAAGAISLAGFAVSLAVFAVVALVLVLVAYHYIESAWLNTYASEERYRNLFQSSKDGIIFISPEGNIARCNPAYASMLGYKTVEVTGKSHRDLTPPQWRAVDADVLENQLKVTGRSDEYNKEYLKKDGSLLPVSVRSWTAYDRRGEPIGTWTLARDASSQKQYEDFIRDTIVRLDESNEKLKEVDRLKNEFVAMVTHELRAPLGAIQSSLSALRAISGEGPTEETVELVDILERGVHRLSRLIEDLLYITRIESGQLEINPVKDDALELAEKVVEQYRSRFAEKGVALKVERGEGPFKGRYDPDRIEQVLTNLVDNALKFTDDGEVSVRVDSSPNRIVFSVIDSGLGIPAELHPRLFDKFYRIEAPGSQGRYGSGLGLAISKGIVKAHGCSIWVESHSDREGSTFSFDVPRSTSS